MLRLDRQAGQAIVIAGNIVVRVLDVHRGRVKLGIEAPRDIPILRSELIPFDRFESPPDEQPS